jgi:Carboxypeptidase regulatory-like domain
MKRGLAAVILGVALPCSGFAAVGPVKVFRITGVAISSHDGSPIPYCRLTATAVRDNPVSGGRGGRGGFGPGGFGGGVPMTMVDAGGIGDVRLDGLIDEARGGDQRRGGPTEPENSTVADAQGHFSLSVPHAGGWRLVGTARGFRSQSYDEHGGFYSQIVLTDAVPVYSLTFRMARDSVISGVVYDEAGEPVRQARVSAELVPVRVEGQPPVAARQVGGATTDDRGHYEMSGLAPGSYRVRVQAQPWYTAGNRGVVPRVGVASNGATATNQNDLGASLDPSLDVVYATTWFPGADSEDAAERIELTGGDERQADFHLNAVSAIHLRVPRPEIAAVTAPDGRPRPQGVSATLTKISSDGAIGQVMSIGGNGTGDMDFGGLTPGIYEVRMPGPDGQPGGGEVKQIEVLGGSRVVTLDGARPLTKVTIKVNGLTNDSFPFVEFVDVETGRRITAQENRGGRGGGRGRRGDDDNAAADTLQDRTLTAMLPPHRYAVSVGGNGGVYLTGMSATDAQVVGHTVEIAGGAPALTLQVGSGHADLAGFVRQDVAKPGGAPTAGAMVLLVPITLGQPGDNSVVERAQSNTDGSFAFRAVEPGRYILVAIDHGWGVQWTNPLTLANYLAHGTPIELKAGGKVSEEVAAVLP